MMLSMRAPLPPRGDGGGGGGEQETVGRRCGDGGEVTGDVGRRNTHIGGGRMLHARSPCATLEIQDKRAVRRWPLCCDAFASCSTRV